MPFRIRAGLVWIFISATLAQAQRTDLSFLDVLHEQSRLEARDVANLETKLIRDAWDLAARTRLLTHYFQYTASHPRLKHIQWVLKHRPDSKLAGSPVVRITPVSNPLSTRSDYEQVRTLWVTNLEVYAGNAAVLSNAAAFFEAEEPVRALELLIRAWRLDPENLMRRAAAKNSYRRLLTRCESVDRVCPDPVWLMQVQSQLGSVTVR